MSQYGINVPPGIPVFKQEEVAPAAQKMADAEGKVGGAGGGSDVGLFGGVQKRGASLTISSSRGSARGRRSKLLPSLMHPILFHPAASRWWSSRRSWLAAAASASSQTACRAACTSAA